MKDRDKTGPAKSNPAGEGSLGLFCDDGGIRAAHSTAQVDQGLALSCLVLACPEEGGCWTQHTKAGRGRGFLQRNGQPQVRRFVQAVTLEHKPCSVWEQGGQARKAREHTAFKKEEVSLARRLQATQTQLGGNLAFEYDSLL